MVFSILFMFLAAIAAQEVRAAAAAKTQAEKFAGMVLIPAGEFTMVSGVNYFFRQRQLKVSFRSGLVVERLGGSIGRAAGLPVHFAWSPWGHTKV